MTVATDRRMTLKEFLIYDDGTDQRYELVDGVLVEMGAESRINIRIAVFLIQYFSSLGLGDDRIGIKEMIEVESAFVATARDADLIIHSAESSLALEGMPESCLTLNDPNPLLVVEVISPGTESTDDYQRDYVQKPREYSERGIPEFWQIDPSRDRVRVLVLDGDSYQVREFRGNEAIISPTFPELNLTVARILRKE